MILVGLYIFYNYSVDMVIRHRHSFANIYMLCALLLFLLRVIIGPLQIVQCAFGNYAI